MPPEEDAKRPDRLVLVRDVYYEKHKYEPEFSEYLLNFTELKGFQRDWDRLGLDIEDDWWGLAMEIMLDPKGGDVIPGTGGLRKLRFSPPRWNTGKRGAVRVLYVYFEEFGHILLVIAYPKTDDQDPTPDEKKVIRRLIDKERQILTERHFS